VEKQKIIYLLSHETIETKQLYNDADEAQERELWKIQDKGFEPMLCTNEDITHWKYGFKDSDLTEDRLKVQNQFIIYIIEKYMKPIFRAELLA
jgi:triosephosphate isomerase